MKLFKEELEFLGNNQYRTLSASDLFKERFQKTGKELCLTFDDCRIDCFGNAHPLLKQYSFKGVMFACPRFINKNNNMFSDKEKEFKYCSWENLKCMVQEGTADIQNHSMEHELVFAASKLIDFQRPYSGNRALYPDFSPSQDTFEWGTPIYEYKWKGATDTEFLPESEISSKCVEFVRNEGGMDFFADKSWKKRILAFYKSISNANYGKNVKIDFDRKSYLRKSLQDSQDIIFKKLGVRPEFFAPPVHSYDSLVIKVLKEEGFKGLFNGSSRTLIDDEGFVIFRRERYGTPLWLSGKGRQGFIRRGVNFIKKHIIR